MDRDRREGAAVRNILADGSEREDMSGCAEGADRLPDLARRLIVHFAQLAGEAENREAENREAENRGPEGG